MRRKLITICCLFFPVYSVFCQNWSTVTLNGVATCSAVEIKNYDYGSGFDRFIMYYFTEGSSSDINTGLIKIDNSNTVVFNNSYKSSTGSSQLILSRLEIDVNNGDLYAIGTKKIGTTTFEPELIKLDPTTGAIVFAKKLSGFYSGYAGFVPADIYITGSEILITGTCQNRTSSTLPLTKTMVIRYNTSTGANTTDVFANVANPSQHTFGATHFVDVWSTGYSLGGWFNTFPSGPSIKPGFIAYDPSPSQNIFDVSEINVAGEDVRQFTWGCFDGWSYMVMRYNNNFDDFTICRFWGDITLDWSASYSLGDLAVIPDPGSADRLKGFSNLIQESVMNLQGNIYHSSNPASTYRFYFGQFSVADGSIITSKKQTLQVPYFPISPTLGSDPIFSGSPARATTAFANRFPTAPSYNDLNTFYYFPEIETSLSCDEDAPLQTISKNVSTSLRTDIQVSSLTPATIADDNTVFKTNVGNVSLSTICTEPMRETPELDPEKVFSYDNIVPEFPLDDLSSEIDGFRKDQPKDERTEISPDLKIYRNGEVVVTQSNKIIRTVEFYSLDGKQLLKRSGINQKSISINFARDNNILLVRVEYSDGKFAIKKILNR